MTYHFSVAIIAAVFLASCSDGTTIKLEQGDWICTRVGEVEDTEIVIAGKVAMPMKATKQACTRYERP